MKLTGSSILKLALAAALATLVFTVVQTASPQPAGRIDQITPPAARVGEQVTISGNGFGALNLQITVGGKAAQILSANGHEATFIVPAGGASGLTKVIATNPGQQSGSIDFRMLEGVLLQGGPHTRALDAMYKLGPAGVNGNQIENGIIMTRVDVRLKPDMTLAELNSALRQVEGGIVSMRPGLPAITIAVPRQSSIQAFVSLVNNLGLMHGIRAAKLGRTPGLMELGLTPPLTTDAVAPHAHLLPGRFPAAWNALSIAEDSAGNCKVPSKVTVIIADSFGPATSNFQTEVSSFQAPSAEPAGMTDNDNVHGYLNAELVAADGILKGTNPVPSCLDLRLLQTAHMTEYDSTMAIADGFPSTGRFIVNYSQGYNDDCFRLGSPSTFDCIPPLDSTLAFPFDRAQDALDWKEQTSSKWSNFLITVSAGNSYDAPSVPIYAGMGDSRYTNKMSISALNDPFFDFVLDTGLWNPSPLSAGFAPMVASVADAAGLRSDVLAAGLSSVASNVLVVGSTTTPPKATLLTSPALPGATSIRVADDSERSAEGSPDVTAVGEDIFGTGKQGTSYAAPQVAGLASYLWLLSPALRNSLPMATTRQAIVANAWPGIGLVDAYATVLSLDEAASLTPTNAPIRFSILDVNNDSKFNEDDVAEYLHKFFFDGNGNTVSEPANADFSRYDLNGDGFTGGTNKARFDLDRVGSTQYGNTVYSTVSPLIENNKIDFDESALTDLQVLCYYAYTDLYTGDNDQRRQLLSQLPSPHRCVFSVKPQSVNLTSGQTQQFEAIGAPQAGVKWTSTCGTINSSTGLFTAGNTGGNCTVQATSLADSNVFAQGTAHVTASSAGLSLSLVRAASLLSHGIASDFYCPSGPTTEPEDPEDRYYTRTPNGKQRQGLSMPPPNVGRFNQLFTPASPATVSANCRYMSFQENSSEIVTRATVIGASVTVEAYVSSTTKFGLPSGGSAEVSLKVPADGFVDVTVNNDWATVLPQSGGGEVIIDATTLGISGAYGCFFHGGPGNTITRSCSGSTHFPVLKDTTLLVVVSISANGEGNGQAITVTYTRN